MEVKQWDLKIYRKKTEEERQQQLNTIRQRRAEVHQEAVHKRMIADERKQIRESKEIIRTANREKYKPIIDTARRVGSATATAGTNLFNNLKKASSKPKPIQQAQQRPQRERVVYVMQQQQQRRIKTTKAPKKRSIKDFI